MERILLIEDNPGDAEMIREAITVTLPRPLEVQVAENGRAAIGLLCAGSYSLVILDLHLREGVDILRAVRANPSSERLPVVVLTTTAREKDCEACVAAGATAVYKKPMIWDEVVGVVQAAVSHIEVPIQPAT